jgi:hypothetical protein
LTQYLGGDPDKNLNKVGGSFEGGKVTIVKAPRHGKVVLSSDEKDASWGLYNYIPREGYYGEDRFVIQVEKNGVKVTIHYVVVTIDDEDHPINYCNPDRWKISQPSIEDYPDLTNWYNATSLYGLLTSAKDALTGFADLSGSRRSPDIAGTVVAQHAALLPSLRRTPLPLYCSGLRSLVQGGRQGYTPKENSRTTAFMPL